MSALGPILQRFRVVVIVLALLAPVGCATVQHRRAADDYAGRCLAADSALGAELLRREMEQDPTIREHVQRAGSPDYVYVLDRKTLYLFQSRLDRVAVFHRGWVEASEVQLFEKIPGSLLSALPRAEMDRVLARRTQAARVARAKKPRARARSRSVPAAPQPGAAGWSLNRFDVDAVVARLRAPRTAADAGIESWRSSRSPDGTIRRTARVSTTHYEVRPDRVTVTEVIQTGSVRTPARMRTALKRVNAAIFGGGAAAVSEVAYALVEQVARDRSGRTTRERRIGGRLIRIRRSVDQGRIIYSVDAG